MRYNTQNHRAFDLCPSSGILGTRKQNVSETGSVSVLMCGGGSGGMDVCGINSAFLYPTST
jgi:hypothetical protein